MSKKGRLSNNDKAFIAENAAKLTPEEIAERLNRTVGCIADYIDSSGITRFAESEKERVDKMSVRAELRSSERWKRLLRELSEDEVRFFEEEYVKLMNQFKGNVLPSEEGQIFDAIKFEVLKSRNMIARRMALDDIGRLEEMQQNFMSQFGGDASLMDDNQRTFVLEMDKQLALAREAEQTRTVEYVKFQERQDQLMKSLKSTRDQRIREIESGKDTVFGLIKMLQQDAARKAEGRQMELMKLAADKEYKRLGQLTEYEDGSLDRPILSPETVVFDA